MTSVDERSGALVFGPRPADTEAVSTAEYWLAHPVDRVVTVYRLEGSAYGRPRVFEMQDRLRCGACSDVEIDWARVIDGLPNSAPSDRTAAGIADS